MAKTIKTIHRHVGSRPTKHVRINRANIKSKKTQKAGGIGYHTLSIIENFIDKSDLVNTLLGLLGYTIKQDGGFLFMGQKPPPAKSPPAKLPPVKQKSNIGYKHLRQQQKEQAQQGNKPTASVDKTKERIKKAIYKYILRVIKYCYKKLYTLQGEFKKNITVIQDGSMPNNKYSDSVVQYFKSVLFNNKPSNMANIMVVNTLVDSLGGGQSRNTYYSPNRYPGQNSRLNYGKLASYRVEAQKLLGNTDISGVKSSLGDLLAFEKDIIEEYKTLNSNSDKKQHGAVISKFLYNRIVLHINTQASSQNKNLASNIGVILPTTIKQGLICDKESSSIFYIIKNRIITESANLSADMFHVIKSRIIEAQCYMTKINEINKVGGKSQEQATIKKNGKIALNNLIRDLLLDKSLAQNNGEGLAYFINYKVNQQQGESYA